MCSDTYCLNIQKHGIDFVAAKEVFNDGERIETVDDRQDYGEERIQTIGYAKPAFFLLSIHIEIMILPDGLFLRIIGVRGIIGECGRARSIIPACESPAPAR